jgi:hypothetical protein
MPPTVEFDDPDADELVTAFIEIPEPTTEQMLALYKAYRETGGDPYEPYESLLKAEPRGTKDGSHD